MSTFIRPYWYKDASLLNALHFSISNDIPLQEAIPHLPLPLLIRNRMQRSLMKGLSFRQALEDAGVPEKEATLMNLKGNKQTSLELLNLNMRSAKMSSVLNACLTESFVYPDLIAVLSIFCWFSFALVDAFHHSISNLVFVFFLVVLFGLQLLLFLPSSRLLASLRLLQQAQILFVYLRSCFNKGIDEAAALRMAIVDLGLIQATGPNAWEQANSGSPFFKVLAEMPAVNAVHFGILPTTNIQGLLLTLSNLAEDEWNVQIEKLRLLLRSVGLLLAGALILSIALRVFLAIYGAGSIDFK